MIISGILWKDLVGDYRCDIQLCRFHKNIKEKNPFLNIELSMLQFPNKKSVNYANYWGLAVRSKAKTRFLLGILFYISARTRKSPNIYKLQKTAGFAGAYPKIFK